MMVQNYLHNPKKPKLRCSSVNSHPRNGRLRRFCSLAEKHVKHKQHMTGTRFSILSGYLFQIGRWV